MNIKNMSNELLFYKYLNFNFNEKYFDKHIECHDMDEIIAVNKAMQLILKEGYGDRLESTASRILRMYSRPHNYIHTTEVDSFFLHTDYMDTRLKGMILDTAKRIEQRNKNKSLEDKIVEGLKTIISISDKKSTNVDQRLSTHNLFIVENKNHKYRAYLLIENKNRIKAAKISSYHISNDLKFSRTEEMVDINKVEDVEVYLENELFYIDGNRAYNLKEFAEMCASSDNQDMKRLGDKLKSKITMLNDIRVYDLLAFEKEINNIKDKTINNKRKEI